MPPPRLPQHLRPCHPLGTAHQVRCAHKPARATFLTDGDDSPPRPHARSDDGDGKPPHDASDRTADAPAQKSSWWSAALSSIASFGFKTAPTRSDAAPPESPVTSTPQASGEKRGNTRQETQDIKPGLIRKTSKSPEKRGNTGQETSDTKPGLIRKTNVSPEKRLRRSQRVAARLERIKEENHSASTVKRLDLKGERRTAARPEQISKETSRTKRSSAPPIRRLVTNVDSPRLRQLQSTIAEQKEIRRSSATSDPSMQTHGVSSHAKTSQGHSGAEARAPIGLQREDSPTIQQQLQQLFEQFRSLQAALEGKLAAEQPPSTSAAVRSTSTTESDISHRTTQQPPPETVPFIRKVSDSEPLQKPVAAATAVSHATHEATEGSAGRKPLAHRGVQTATKGYHSSTTTFIHLANELENMRSPVTLPILSHVRNRLREIAEVAKLEKDSDMAGRLGHYKNWKMLYAEARYSPTVIKQPLVMLRLQISDVQSRFNKMNKEARHLRKEISLITPASPRMRIHPATTTLIKRLKSKKGRTAEKKNDGQTSDQVANALKATDSMELYSADKKNDGQRLTRQIHTQSRSMKSSDGTRVSDEGGGSNSLPKDKMSPKPPPEADSPSLTATKLSPIPTSRNDELSEQSLLEELFPEATSTPQPPHPEKRDQYPKLELPDSKPPIIRREIVEGPRSAKERIVDSFRSKGEQITVLQLTHCSTELTEADFRRLIPKGKHIEAWRRDGEFYKIIPGRDPLSLERLPFYYLLFKNAESALAYQKNVSRLHKLSALHQPANIFSAIPPPKGFLEEGEDITALVQSYNLLPTHHPLTLNVLMQPYNPTLRALVERGGYQPVAPSTASDGTKVWKVLLQIEGYEPTPSDLFKILSRDAYKNGMSVPLRNESHASIHRLRDIINLKTSIKSISSANPRAYATFSHPNHDETTYDDPAIQAMLVGAEEDNANALNQLVMNRVYNRWVLDFETEDEARRWCLRWHRRVLPELSHGKGSWREGEEVRVCNTEVLW